MLEDGLDSLGDLADNIYLESFQLFYKSPNAVEEYVSTQEISLGEKIDDIDEMISFAERKELYEYCAMLKIMKDRIND
tara:strand:+ start:190 stop:423 length:234 start_codon:yes stop_codon:yes gene_type:complete